MLKFDASGRAILTLDELSEVSQIISAYQGADYGVGVEDLVFGRYTATDADLEHLRELARRDPDYVAETSDDLDADLELLCDGLRLHRPRRKR